MSKKQYILPLDIILNTSMEQEDERELKERDYMWASELGSSFYDRYLTMKGVPPSNPPNQIAIRKFKVGHLIEDYIKIILFQAGLLKKYEDRVYSDFDFGLKVSGKMDVVYGGELKINKLEELLNIPYLTFINYLSKPLLEFAEKFNQRTWSDCGIEIKSCSDHIYNFLEETKQPQEHHALQAFHYSYWLKIPFVILYFDKNNGRIMQFVIYGNEPELLNKYVTDIKLMTNIFNAGIEPPKEPIFVLKNNKIQTNWKIQYSKYLTYGYGYKSKQDFLDNNKPKSDRWSRVLERIKQGKELTKDNLLAIKEMQEHGFDVGVPKVVDVDCEIVNDNEPTEKKSSKQKLLSLQNLLGGKS